MEDLLRKKTNKYKTQYRRNDDMFDPSNETTLGVPRPYVRRKTANSLYQVCCTGRMSPTGLKL